MFKQIKLSILFLFVIASSQVMATEAVNTFHINSITTEIEEFVYSRFQNQYSGRMEVKVGSLDRRLKLKSCEHPLDYEIPDYMSNGQRVTVKVQCHEPRWMIYVPTTVKVYKPVVVTTRPISRNELLTNNDVSLQEVDISSLNEGYFEDPSDVIDYVVNYPTRAGMILIPRAIAKPKIIVRGDMVSLVAESEGLIVRMHGMAMEDGALGDNIKIKNSSSKKVVEGIVMGSGTVKMLI